VAAERETRRTRGGRRGRGPLRPPISAVRVSAGPTGRGAARSAWPPSKRGLAIALGPKMRSLARTIKETLPVKKKKNPSRRPAAVATDSSAAPDRTLLHWEEALAVGIPAIDQAHRTILAKLNQLHRLFGDPREELGAEQVRMRRLLVAAQAGLLLDFLERYAREHFAQEEALMACAACGFREKHAKAHWALRGLLHEWTVQCHRDLEGGSNERIRQVIAEFGAWFKRHLRTEDCRLRALRPAAAG
jgi:hemerythrin-like metal-binding protein